MSCSGQEVIFRESSIEFALEIFIVACPKRRRFHKIIPDLPAGMLSFAFLYVAQRSSLIDHAKGV